MYDCVVLCGGMGTRLRSVTGDLIPKSLVTVDGRPLMQYTLDLLSPAFVDRVFFSVDHHSDQIEAFVASMRLPYPTSFCYQERPGVLDAVKCAARASGREPILFVHSDEVRPGLRLDEALAYHERGGSMASVVATRAAQLHRHWIVEYDDSDFTVTNFRIQPQEYRHDPEQQAVVLAGGFILDRAAVDMMDPTVDSGYLGIVKPLVDIGALKVFIGKTVAHFNVGTPEELAEADAYLRHTRALNQN